MVGTHNAHMRVEIFGHHGVHSFVLAAPQAASTKAVTPSPKQHRGCEAHCTGSVDVKPHHARSCTTQRRMSTSEKLFANERGVLLPLTIARPSQHM